ncbi:MAG: SDR family oxidoreductase [Bacillota bacterium]|nr:SDR family oxidoreductase [Bacillota bacterium]
MFTIKKECELFDVSGRTAIVTGGSGVLCSEMAKALGAAGANVVILARNTVRIDAVLQEILDCRGVALGLEADVLDRNTLIKVKEKVLDKFGSIDILVNGAGGNRAGATTNPKQTFFDLPIQELSAVFDLNFLGSLLPSQIFGSVMADSGRGVIVNISSASSFRPMTRVVGYSGAKAAINNFTEWLAVYMAQEYSPEIRVNAIAPGFFIAEQNYSLLIQPNGEYTERGNKILTNIPMARFGDPKDLVGTLLWLVSDASKFVTGTIINVDGGFNAFSGV